MRRQTTINALMFLAYAAAIYAAGMGMTWIDTDAVGISLFLIIASLGLGIAAQLVFDWSCTRSFGAVYKNSVFIIAFGSILLLLFSFETAICLVIGVPITLITLAIGLSFTRWIMGRILGRTLYCMPLLIVPFLTPLVDLSGLTPTQTYTVSTEIEMRGTAQSLRALTQDVPLITDAERPWTLTHSILRAPRPLRAELRDGVRYATWEEGVAFEEIISESNDPNRLDWTFHFPDPALLGPIDYRVSPLGPEVFLDSGGYRFDPVGPDRTLVTLTTTYRLKTVMNGYLALWGEVFLDDFHMAVLHVIAQRAEVTL